MSRGGLPARLAWYGQRLSRMSAGEILHRVAELSKKQAARIANSGWHKFDVADGPLPVFSARIDPALAGERLVADWQRFADDTMARRHRFLGVEWPTVGNASLWHFDPVSRREWPRDAYCFDINYRHNDLYGDVKYVWEINRLQYLQPLAALAAVSGRADIRDFVVAEIDSWIAENPPFRGVNWPSGIELCLRAISVLIVTRLLGEEAFSPPQRRAIRSFLAATAVWLYRYPSRYSSANNHLVAEAVGLLVIALACPDLNGAARWEAYARRILTEEAALQFHSDGIGAEQSPTYTAFTLELFLTAVKVAEAAGKPLEQTVIDRLGRAGEALSWFMDENGKVPRIGDDDEGRVLVSDPAADRLYVASILSATATICGRPEIAPPVAPLHLRDLVFGRVVGVGRQQGVQTFAEGGYSVLRDRVNGRDLIVCMDHGPLGYLSIAAHGHADALAVWLTYGGKPLLSDAGTYLYHSGGVWRDAFRGTPLHNTLSIEGESSSLVSGAFNWKTKANVRDVIVESDLAFFRCQAVHDGYSTRFGVRHARNLHRISTERFLIEDRLEGDEHSVHEVSISYLAGEGVEICKSDDAGIFDFLVDGTVAMRLVAPPQLAGRIVFGQEDDKLGWLSPCFGVKLPVFQLIFEGKMRGGEAAVTELELI